MATNGKVELNEDERQLLLALLQQVPLASAHHKMLAASIQTKLEE